MSRSKRIKVRGVRREEIDTKALARAFLMIAETERRKKGLPPLTPEEHRYSEAFHVQVQAEVEAKRRARSPESQPDEPSDLSDPSAIPGDSQP